MNVIQMHEDSRSISRLLDRDGDTLAGTSIFGHATSIKVYLEVSGRAWFGVFRGEEMTDRINSRYVSRVVYE